MKRRIIFQHIPKTAGTSLANVILSQFKEDHKFVCGRDGVLNNFISLDQNRKNQIKLLIGHVDFGIHKYFDDESLYITFLRDPVKRVVSHYYFIKSHKQHRYHKHANQMRISEFITSGIRPRMNNCMTRMISGISPRYHCCNEEMLYQAINNISAHYAFYGFYDMLDQSVDHLVKVMNWEKVELSVTNATPNKPSIDKISDKITDLIIEYNQLDIKLYNLLLKKYYSIK